MAICYSFLLFVTVSRESLVFLLGLIIFIAPVIGVPPEWKEYLMIVSGVLLVILGFSLRRSSYYRKIDRGNGEFGSDSFVESLPDQQSTEVDLVDYETELEVEQK